MCPPPHLAEGHERMRTVSRDTVPVPVWIRDGVGSVFLFMIGRRYGGLAELWHTMRLGPGTTGIVPWNLCLEPKPHATHRNSRFSLFIFITLHLPLHLTPISASMEHASALLEALSEDGDMELRLQGGRSIPVHSMKLKFASSVLKDVITATLDDQIATASAKRRKTADGGSAAGQDMPYVQVSILYMKPHQGHGSLMRSFRPFQPCMHAPLRLTAHTRTGWRF